VAQQIVDAERALKAELTDWDNIYLKIRMSPLGDDYPKEKFLRTPVQAIIPLLTHIDNEEQRANNISSLTTAKLCAQVLAIAHGMSGSKGKKPKIRVEDFLPFPDWSPDVEGNKGPNEATKKILSMLIRERKLPMYIFVQLMSAPTE
jgi:hypothetical protein